MEAKRLLSKCLLFSFKPFLFDPFVVDEERNLKKERIRSIYTVSITLLLSCSLVCIWMILIDDRADNAELLSAISYGVAGTIALVNYYLFALHKTKVARLLINVESNMFTYRFNENEPNNNDLCRQQNVKRLVVFMNVLAYGNVFVAGTISAVSRIVWNDLKALTYPSWFPWSTETLIGYLVSELILTTIACFVCSLNLANTVYAVTIYLEYRRQHERLRMAINKIPERAAIATELTFSELPPMKTAIEKRNIYSREFDSYLTECIDHHRTLRM